MSPSITTPAGFAFVPRGPGVAAALLDAADEIGADRKLDVRTVAGGYRVTQAVAEEYQKGFEGVEEADQESKSEPDQGTEAGQEAEETGAEAGQESASDSVDDSDSDDSGETVDDSDETPDEGAPQEGWTHAQFDEWAKSAGVTFPKDSNLKQKLEIATQA